MMSTLLRARNIRLALSALGVAVIVLAWAIVDAARLTPIAEAAPPEFSTAGATAKRPVLAAVPVAEVVSMNAFSPERHAPARRYRVSGYREESPTTPPPQPLVLGTAVATGNRSFAICKVGDSPTTIVRVGDKIAGYTVVAIERKSVVFTTPTGERLVVTAS